MARRFTVIFEKEEEGGYHIFCPVLPGCHTQSETIDEGTRNIREAIQLYIDSLVEDGLPVPPAGERSLVGSLANLQHPSRLRQQLFREIGKFD